MEPWLTNRGDSRAARMRGSSFRRFNGAISRGDVLPGAIGRVERRPASMEPRLISRGDVTVPLTGWVACQLQWSHG